jgi:branched-chain amino acid transport system ATP-binding protein
VGSALTGRQRVTGFLQVDGVMSGYGDVRVLWGVDLEMAEGEVACLVGSNGAGKSTLVNTIVGILRPRRGRINLGDEDITDMPGHRVCRAGVAIVPEGRRLFPAMTVEDNLDLGAFNPVAREHREESMRWVHALFPRLADRRSQLAGSLSGGEQQMLAIGRALMANPELILMDEPSEGLSPRLVQQVQEIMQRLRALGQAILLVEQNLQLALSAADNVYVLSAGRFVFDGTAAALANETQILDQHLGVSSVKAD